MNSNNQFNITSDDVLRLARVANAETRLDASDVRLSWDLLALLEPRLEPLLMDGQPPSKDGESEPFCSQRHWSLDLKPCLLVMVGWCRRDFHPILSTRQAYELAYDTLLEAVPPCHGCSCGKE